MQAVREQLIDLDFKEEFREKMLEDVFQQGALLFIIAVYDYEERPPTTFAGYMKKRIDWGLWVYYRGYLKQQIEISSGLKTKER